MEAHSPPAKLPRFSDHEMGVVMGGGLTAIGLDLGLGPRLSYGKSGFTFLQLQELEHQALIFKYIAAGVPVPSHLVLPIWKSLAGSNTVSGMYPSFLGFRGVFFDYRNSLEPEPGRCRRTDGKKWRCSKDVVPDQKYCERHMHRGRNRSRKHVESTSQTIASSSSPSSANVTNESNTNLSISIIPSTTSTTTTSNYGYSRFGLSPNSVLPAGICKTESSL